MSAKDLKTWMAATGLNEIDIASRLKINPVTVKRFLKGKRILPSIQNQLEQLVKEHSPPVRAG